MKMTNGSLRLIDATNVEVYKNDFGRWKIKFLHNGNAYDEIPMTDTNCFAVNELESRLYRTQKTFADDRGGRCFRVLVFGISIRICRFSDRSESCNLFYFN
jgi:hypothetical protein